MLEDAHILENNASETFGIRTVLRQEINHYMEYSEDYLTPITPI